MASRFTEYKSLIYLVFFIVLGAAVSILNAEIARVTALPGRQFDQIAQYIFANVESVNKTVRYLYVYSKEVNEAGTLGQLVLILVFPFLSGAVFSAVFLFRFSDAVSVIRDFVWGGRNASRFWTLVVCSALLVYQAGFDIFTENLGSQRSRSIHRMNTLDINLNRMMFSISAQSFLLVASVQVYLILGLQILARIFCIARGDAVKVPDK